MKVVHGRVEDGRVVVDEALPEGAEVTVLVTASDDSFDLAAAQIAALRVSIDEADRGALVPLEDARAAKIEVLAVWHMSRRDPGL